MPAPPPAAAAAATRHRTTAQANGSTCGSAGVSGKPVRAYGSGPPAAASTDCTAAQAPGKPGPRRDNSRQQTLDLQDNLILKTSIEASVYCGAPVAIAAHRVMAAGIDAALAVVALGVFLATFHLAGAEIVLTKDTLPYLLCCAALISLFYRVLFCIANRDTPGVRWTGLRVLDFDGRTPTRKQRWYRLLGGFVGAIAAGIGLIWAIFDEEKLTWHDHMSKTFPTPRFF